MSCAVCPLGVSSTLSVLSYLQEAERMLMWAAGYKTEHFWLEYPHREMTWELKTYYLVQAAYWLQQTILLAAKIEKPRKDFKELVAHVGISDEKDM